jgi:hypothetical protein
MFSPFRFQAPLITVLLLQLQAKFDIHIKQKVKLCFTVQFIM